MKLPELATGGALPLIGRWACSVTVASGAVTGIDFTTPVPLAEALVEDLFQSIAIALTRLNLINRDRIAANTTGQVYSINGVNQAASFAPTAYQPEGAVAPAIDLTTDIGAVTSAATFDEGGSVTIAISGTLDRDQLVVEFVPVVDVV
jgi:hypothetical protein